VVRVSKELQPTKLLWASMIWSNGGMSFGKQELVATNKYGYC